MKRRSDHGLAIFLAGIVAGSLLLSIGIVGFGIRPASSPVSLAYPDLAAVMLAAVAVLVTVLGVFVAILAIWGYSQFGDMAREAAIEHVKEELEEGSVRNEIESFINAHVARKLEEPDGTLRNLLVERVDRIILGDAERRSKNTSGDRLANEDSEYGE